VQGGTVDHPGLLTFVGGVVKDAAELLVECRRGAMLSRTAALGRW